MLKTKTMKYMSMLLRSSTIIKRCIPISTYCCSSLPLTPHLTTRCSITTTTTTTNTDQDDTECELATHLRQRGLLQRTSLPPRRAALFLDPHTNPNGGIYVGFDPSAHSLHLGNLLPIVAAAACRAHGLHTVLLVGGGTAALGDPTDRVTERIALSTTTLASNTTAIRSQLSSLATNVDRYLSDHKVAQTHKKGTLSIVDNSEWLDSTSILAFFRGAGKLLRAGPLIDRTYVQQRLAAGTGISLAEFVYQAFQAFDFLQLRQTRGTNIQLGGADQWGNLIAGVSLVERAKRAGLLPDDGRCPVDDLDANQGEDPLPPVMCLTTPLLVDSRGNKIGKTTGGGNRVWLDRNATTELELFRHCVRLADADAERYLRVYSCLNDEELADAARRHADDPRASHLQLLTAHHLVWLVHGRDAADIAATRYHVLKNLNKLALSVHTASTAPFAAQHVLADAKIALRTALTKAVEQDLVGERRVLYVAPRSELGTSPTLPQLLKVAVDHTGEPAASSTQIGGKIVAAGAVRVNGEPWGARVPRIVPGTLLEPGSCMLVRLSRDRTIVVVIRDDNGTPQ